MVQAFEEILLAGSACEQMKGVGDFAQYERAWRDFLARIERAWNKIEAATAASSSSNWPTVKTEIERARSSDPLLVYIRQARNSDEHSIQNVAVDWEPNLHAAQVGRQVTLTWSQWDRPLLPVTNRGVTYNPPRSHLGQSFEHLLGKGKSEARIVADLAMAYYVEVFNEVLNKVVGLPSRSA